MPPRWLVRFRLRPRLGYSGDLADIAHWRRQRPRDVVRRLESGFEVSIHLEEATPEIARDQAGELLGNVFRRDRYQTDMVELRPQVG